MATRSRYLFIASMDVEPAKQAIFNEVYNTEHCPMLSQVPGVGLISRFELQDLNMSMGGETRTIKIEGEPTHHAIYELESPEVLTSAAWAEAVEVGRWPGVVRPHTRNRRIALHRVVYPPP